MSNVTNSSIYGESTQFKISEPHGSTGTVSDIDGNIYNTIKIGTHWLMAENLKAIRYSNKAFIGTTTPATLNIEGETSPKYQWAYGGNESNVATYGRLYTWYAVTDSRNICPAGWHVPTDAEWTTMENYLIANGYNYDGTTSDNKIAKALAATTNWTFYPVPGTVGNTDYPDKRNITGFSALPGGSRYSNGTFNDVGYLGHWWSSTEYSTTYAWYRGMYYYDPSVFIYNATKSSGFSVRCLMD